MRKILLKFYSLAVLAPFMATALAFLIQNYLPRGNISMVYLLAVLIVAARTSTKPAVACALLSFMLYNFFFTEPRYSLLMIHREDILTVGFFLLMAALTGHQAARLRQQVLALQNQSRFARIQLDLLEELAGAINNRQIYRALHAALSKLPLVSCSIIEPAETRLEVVCGSALLDKDAVARALSGDAGKRPDISGRHCYFALQDGIKTVAVAGVERDAGAVNASPSRENIETMVHQVCLALARIRLAGDLEKERLEKERELLRSALLTSVSHDLRTPLSSMIGSASSLIELGGSLSEGQKHELLEAILQEASRLDGYIQNLLDMTRLGYGGLGLERDWIGLDEILSVVMRRIRPLLKSRQVKTAVPPDLPLLYVHAALIEQAIYNVLENAVNYSPPGSTVRIDAFVSGPNVLVDLRDEGPGIPEAERERVFDMFYTVKRRDSHSAGTGLGLAICRGMIGAHGGGVEILDNDRGKGSLFRLRLPLPVEPGREASA